MPVGAGWHRVLADVGCSPETFKQLQSTASPRCQRSHPPVTALGLCWRISGCWEAKGVPGLRNGDETLTLVPGALGALGSSWTGAAAFVPASLFPVEVSPHLLRGPGLGRAPKLLCSSRPLRAPLGRAGPGRERRGDGNRPGAKQLPGKRREGKRLHPPGPGCRGRRQGDGGGGGGGGRAMGEEAEDSAGGGGSRRLPEPPPPRVSLRCPGAPGGSGERGDYRGG